MKRTATDLRANLYATLDHVAATGETVEIERGGVQLRIVRVEQAPTVRRKRRRTIPDLVVGDPDDLIHLEWPWSQGRGP